MGRGEPIKVDGKITRLPSLYKCAGDTSTHMCSEITINYSTYTQTPIGKMFINMLHRIIVFHPVH